uniref:Uncharacterized protein n=1 Tax=Panagrolaimus superbus TaxID=310955 RepID=A0A914XZ65_9BILA
MGIDDNTENWNKENFSTTFGKRAKIEAGDGTAKFEPLPKKYSFKLIATHSKNDLLDDPDDPWTIFKKKFIYNDENLSDSDIFNELLELCSWYDPKDDSDSDRELCDDDEDLNEEIEMIKRNLNSEMKYSSPPQQQQSNHGNSLKLYKNTSYIGLSSLRLSSSPNLSKRRQIVESPNKLCPKKRVSTYTPFQSHHKSSMDLDQAISCAAQNLDVDLPALITSPPPAAPKPLERKNSDFWNELDSVTF